MASKNSSAKKWFLLIFILGALATTYSLGFYDYLSLGYVKSQLVTYQLSFQKEPLKTVSVFFTVYVFCAAFSIPGATVLTLLAGALFGSFWGTLIVSFSSTLGATLAFLLSRTLFYNSIQQKFKAHLESINTGIENEGPLYLLTLRLLPVFPFFVVNLVMGLTPISLVRFYLFSQIGMLPGTFVYVNAGQELAKIDSLASLVSPGIFISLALLGLLPLIIKFILSYLKTKKIYKDFKKPSSWDYNMIVIGGGAAGLVSSFIASTVKAKVALIEKHKMGGDCLNTGCVPSKALIRSARHVWESKNSALLGIKKSDVEFSFSEVMSRVHDVIKKIEPHDSIERYSNMGVDCLTGEAQILSPWEVKIGDKTLTTKNIVIASGASPRIVEWPGLKDVGFLTSENLWELKELPKKLVVIGGGPIGCELAQAFSFLGSKVTVIDNGEHLMPREDNDVSLFMEKVFAKCGIDIIKKAEVQKFEKVGIGGKVQIKIYNQSEPQDIYFDKVLLALGRAANVKGFGLEQLNIPLTKEKTIQVDSFLRTNYPNIYACGDAAGPYQFTHVAAHQAWYASVNSLFSPFKKFAVDYRVIPWATYTKPEVARVGINEHDALKSGLEVEKTIYGIDDLDRAIADSKDHGFVKVLTAKGSDKILGVTIIADNASEMLPEFVLAMKYNLGLNKILGTIHTYPTMSEANKYAAGMWKKAHAPRWVFKYLKMFFNWRRGAS